MPSTDHYDPAQVTEAVLRRTSTRDLLTAAYALTHRIHENTAWCGSGNAHAKHGRWCEGLEVGSVDLRAQRDLITAEILDRA